MLDLHLLVHGLGEESSPEASLGGEGARGATLIEGARAMRPLPTQALQASTPLPSQYQRMLGSGDRRDPRRGSRGQRPRAFLP